MTFIGGAVTFIGGAVTFIGRTCADRACADRACVGRSLYKLGCRKSLALVKEEGKTSGACAGGAYIDRACIDRACADKACVGRAVTFIGKGSSAVGRLFKTAKARAVDNIKGVNKRDLRQ